ncbi:MAG TPA: AMP-binding protein, partial [Acidimicrobiales bacterium]|nr:AMP-binding protein [Acidimicrobiales bacterium]
MYIGDFAATAPDRAAVVMGGSGQVVTYGQLDQRSNQFAHLLWDLGLRRGDHYAVMMENHPVYFELVWAGMRSGLYITAVNSHLTAVEAAYIVNDCGATVLITSAALAGVADELVELTPTVEHRFMVDGVAPGHRSYEDDMA